LIASVVNEHCLLHMATIGVVVAESWFGVEGPLTRPAATRM